MTNTWLLLLTFYLPNKQYQYHMDVFANKEHCIQYAKDCWRNYYGRPRPNILNIETICSNKNSYIRIECDKSGVCNK
jgi:hypothetical protein